MISTDAVKTPEAALKAQVEAQWKRAFANEKERADPVGAHWECLEAAELDAIADRILDPRRAAPTPLAVGRGGELIVETTGTRNYRADQLRDTVSSNPDMITARASQERLDLAIQAGVLALAADAADTIGAANSFEKMLAAQLAALHTITMKNAATAASFANIAADGYVPDDQRQVASVEAARSANVAARASEAFQRGILTLDKFRNGGRQTVVVQHVNVGEGGRAVVAGEVQNPGAGHR